MGEALFQGSASACVAPAAFPHSRGLCLDPGTQMLLCQKRRRLCLVGQWGLAAMASLRCCDWFGSISVWTCAILSIAPRQFSKTGTLYSHLICEETVAQRGKKTPRG